MIEIGIVIIIALTAAVGWLVWAYIDLVADIEDLQDILDENGIY